MRNAAIKIIRLFVVLASLGMVAAFGAVALIALTGNADISGFEMGSAFVVGIAPLPWFALLMTKAIWSQKRIPSSAFLSATIFSITLAICSLIRLGYDQQGLSGNAQRLRIEMQAILICPLLWGLYKVAVHAENLIRGGKPGNSVDEKAKSGGETEK